ncbi:hypothetical protein [Candidatus Protochlamydia phocaeensis]|uniref:hypothetical protein n=1 Tax=Candidatus Protochlamydia phocaeensis TaxID=1414722 RepID=UPI0008386C51|nr:hypothetical protein [Candidatus Protochlamydia phocaeensis]
MVHPIQSGCSPEPIMAISVVEPLRPFFERLIDKKINHMALNAFEKIVDFLCRYLYAAYNRRLEYKLAILNLANNLDQTHPALFVAEKVHHFMDGTPLYDRTREGIAGIRCKRMINLVTRMEAYKCDYITLNGKIVRFSENPEEDLLFGRAYATHSVSVQNHPTDPHLIEIIEKEVNRENKWVVNPSQLVEHPIRFGQLQVGTESLYLAREA